MYLIVTKDTGVVTANDGATPVVLGIALILGFGFMYHQRMKLSAPEKIYVSFSKISDGAMKERDNEIKQVITLVENEYDYLTRLGPMLTTGPNKKFLEELKNNLHFYLMSESPYDDNQKQILYQLADALYNNDLDSMNETYERFPQVFIRNPNVKLPENIITSLVNYFKKLYTDITLFQATVNFIILFFIISILLPILDKATVASVSAVIGVGSSLIKK